MNKYIHTTTRYIAKHKKIFSVGTILFVLAIAVVCAAAFALYDRLPKVIYQPVKACELLTPAKAQDLLGDKVISVDTTDPEITGNLATSKCSYTDSNSKEMMVAAIAVRSGLNDDGVRQNKADFTAQKPTQDTETVAGIGDSAYFNKRLGQLNILSGRKWMILSYGVGATPEVNTLDKAKALAQKVLP